MYRCKVCGEEFLLKSESRYIAEEPRSGIAMAFSATRLYECFDCPYCGCQNIVNERYTNYKNTLAGMAVDEKEREEVPDCLGEYKGEDKCEECERNVDCLKETVLEAQNTLDKYKDAGLLKFPNCFGTYDISTGCEDCDFENECYQKTCESTLSEEKVAEESEEKEEPQKPECFGTYHNNGDGCEDCDKWSECFQKMQESNSAKENIKSTEDKEENEIKEKPECFSYYANESKCNECEYKESCVSESWEEEKVAKKKPKGKRKHSKPNCFGAYGGGEGKCEDCK